MVKALTLRCNIRTFEKSFDKDQPFAEKFYFKMRGKRMKKNQKELGKEKNGVGFQCWRATKYVLTRKKTNL